ncbi:hypothetical protein TNCT_173501 [Trichonephila clavata]|uniref:Uncharacterized protein n=1 Tax=Trichonephila clavata TaxID=2740835 RepID=A0A8X6LY00_TRICU|nr:hypothetical protein TNCT_173501 [Trichonephila clavata]
MTDERTPYAPFRTAAHPRTSVARHSGSQDRIDRTDEEHHQLVRRKKTHEEAPKYYSRQASLILFSSCFPFTHHLSGFCACNFQYLRHSYDFRHNVVAQRHSGHHITSPFHLKYKGFYVRSQWHSTTKCKDRVRINIIEISIGISLDRSLLLRAAYINVASIVMARSRVSWSRRRVGPSFVISTREMLSRLVVSLSGKNHDTPVGDRRSTAPTTTCRRILLKSTAPESRSHLR